MLHVAGRLPENGLYSTPCTGLDPLVITEPVFVVHFPFNTHSVSRSRSVDGVVKTPGEVCNERANGDVPTLSSSSAA